MSIRIDGLRFSRMNENRDCMLTLWLLVVLLATTHQGTDSVKGTMELFEKPYRLL